MAFVVALMTYVIKTIWYMQWNFFSFILKQVVDKGYFSVKLLNMETKYNLEVYESGKWVSVFKTILFDVEEIATLYKNAKEFDPKGIYQIVEVLV